MMEVSSRIPEKLFFRIGEVCELIKVQPHVLRYWETEFPMLAPQKNRAGQRVYRRKDVEMVLRIRDLLYEEKFTIAGAKKKLMDEMRGSSTRGKNVAPDSSPAELPALPDEADDVPISEPIETVSEQTITPQARRALRVIKRDLEDLLTLLNSNASIKS
ncbi:MAG TPA: MerR family transcriptional regulator [Blastocatellia bacterium]|nr:MerR family transcriptional regulator [Blastocatellia bacterium]